MRYKRWSHLKGEKGILLTDNPVSCGVHCPMHTALSVIRGTKGISTLVVGMPECCFYSRFVVDNLHFSDRHYTYILDGNEVVFGCREGIMEALRTMAADGSKRVLVLRTCIPSLIGEDLEQAAADVEAETGIKIHMIDVAHYKHNGWMAGFSMVMEALGSFAPALEPKRQINCLGEVQGKEWERLEGELTGAGYETVALFEENTAQWTNLSAGCLNLVFSKVMEPLARRLEARFGTEWLDMNEAAGKAGIAEQYRKLSEKLGIRIAAPPCCPQKPLPGECVSTISTPEAGTLACLLEDLGISLKGLHLEEAIERPAGLKADPEVFFRPSSARHGASELLFADGTRGDGEEVLKVLKQMGAEREEALAELICRAQRRGSDAVV